MKKLNVLGVCAGQGVCLFPFHKSKYFRVLANIEPRGVFYDKGDKQWNANFEGVQMAKSLKLKRRVDVIIGHPDCGDNSILRMSRAKKSGNSETNQSVLAYIDAVNRYSPAIFLLENLPGFLKTLGVENGILSGLLKDQYDLYHIVEPVTVFGNSQLSRVRLVIVGVHKSGALASCKPFRDLYKLRKGLKPSEYFELGKADPSIGHVREPLDKLTNLYFGDKRQITYQEALDRWNGELKNNSRWPVGGKMKNQPGISKNLVGKPPYTVRKQNRQFGTSGLVLSAREMGNIQGVPSEFKIYYSNSNSIYWINKGRLAMTKTMPYEIGKFFMRLIRKQHRANKFK